MKTSTPQTIHLKDYAPPAYLVDAVDLDFDIDADGTAVRATLAAPRNLAVAAQLRFQAPAVTHMICAGEALMEQEQAFLKALSTVAAARHEGNRLELRTAEGALAVTLVREGRE